MKYFNKKFLLFFIACSVILLAKADNFVVNGNEYAVSDDGNSVTLRAFVGDPDTLKCYVIPDVVENEGKIYPVTMLDFYQGFSEISLDELYVGSNLQYLLYDSFYSNSVRRVVWNARNCEVLDLVTSSEPAKTSASRSRYVEPYGFGKIRTERLEEVVIGDEVVSLPEQFVQGAVIKSLHIPASLTDIHSSSFFGCEGLESISVDAANPFFDSRDGCNGVVRTADDALVLACATTRIPAGIKVIETRIYCSLSVKSVVLPNSIIKIESEAFGDCAELETLECHVADPSDIELSSTLDFSSFYGIPTKTCVLYVPKGSAGLYRRANQWKDFANIVEMDEETPPLKGDLNGDGKVDVEDVNALVNIILKVE